MFDHKKHKSYINSITDTLLSHCGYLIGAYTDTTSALDINEKKLLEAATEFSTLLKEVSNEKQNPETACCL